MRDDNSKIKVLLICGAGRSGSTIFEKVLNQYPGFFPIGEFRHFWKRSIIDKQLCACGENVFKCEFWSKIIDSNELGSKRKHKKFYNLSKINDNPFSFKNYLNLNKTSGKQYVEILERLYDTISRNSNNKIIIDSSKTPSHGFILNRCRNIELYIIHLVRDPRAVAYSWSKKNILRPEITDAKKMMPVYSIYKTMVWWAGTNIMSKLLSYKSKRYKLVLYDKFCNNPDTIVECIMKELMPKQEMSNLFKVKESNNKNSANHSLSGNPIRFNKGNIDVKIDNEWMRKLTISKKVIINIFLRPFFYKYFQK